MKIQFMKMLLVLGLLIGLGNVTARAQALSEGTIEADVPHAFIVKDTTLPVSFALYLLSRASPER